MNNSITSTTTAPGAAKIVTTYGYDANGNRIEQQTDCDAMLYHYDAAGKLITADS